MAKGTEDHVGFLVPQSKHIYKHSAHAPIPCRTSCAYLIGWLRLQFLEDLL